MNLQSQSVTAALVLFPVYLPRWKTPVLPEQPGPPIPDGGLSQAASASPGVEMVIEPFTEMKNWTMAPYDVAEIYVNDSPTGVSKTIYPGEENDRFLLLVPALWFINGINKIFYRVKRVSGNFNDSRELNVLYHNPIIGSPAPTGINVSHPAFIGPGQTGAITINISYMPLHSKVTLKIGSWSITFTNLTSPINHTLTSAELSLIGDGKHRVSVIAIDQLDNAGVSTDTDIEIRANQAPLAIDQSLMVLNGPKIIQNYGWLTKKVPGNSAIRSATGGVEPYVYTSSNPLVATAIATGEVTGEQNGQAIIEVTDAKGAKVSYPINVSNVIRVYVNDALLTCEQAYNWAASLGGTMNSALPFLSDALQSNLVDVRQAFFNSIGEPGRRWGYVVAHPSFPGKNFFGWWEANNSTVIAGAGHALDPGQFPDPVHKAKAIVYVRT
ncbi:Ig-like domain-containing protein [Pseudomonas allokribbensis]|uniref:Ig-like domain-containing protein n=1 Tax=Pseudomonas allokribbensis TaxID=2774460 RepID=UPI001787C9D4|nr:Ig-like domain-containing protein [Pseudomonas allokribbensis]